ILDPQHHVPQDIGNRKCDYGAILAEKVIRQIAADERQKITRGNEEGHVQAGIALPKAKLIGHVGAQDGAHAVVRAALGEFSPKNKPESWRMALQESDQPRTLLDLGIGAHLIIRRIHAQSSLPKQMLAMTAFQVNRKNYKTQPQVDE